MPIATANLLLAARATNGRVIVNSDVRSGSGHITITAGNDIDLNEDVRTGACAGDVNVGSILLRRGDPVTIDDGADTDATALSPTTEAF